MKYKINNIFIKELILFLIGGFSYYGIEVLYRLFSSWTMIIVGGICFCIIGGLNNWFTFQMSLLKQGIISSVIVTIVEYISGYIINIKLGMGVWDYSQIPFNINGQICLLYSILWIFLSLIAIVIDDYIRYFLFDEEKPHYKVI